MEFFIVGSSINLMRVGANKMSWHRKTPSRTEMMDAYPSNQESVMLFKTEADAVAFAASQMKREFPAKELIWPVFKVEYTGNEESLDWKTRDIGFKYSYPEENQHPLSGTVFFPGGVKYVRDYHSTTINYCDVSLKQLELKSGVLREPGPLENSTIICQYNPYSTQCVLF